MNERRVYYAKVVRAPDLYLSDISNGMSESTRIWRYFVF
jgi:hypothetical protein